MALQKALLFRIYRKPFQPLIIFQNYFKGTPKSSKSPTIGLDDVLDNFTTELLKKKIDAWEMRNDKYKSFQFSSPERFSHVRVRGLSKVELGEIFTSALNECNDSDVIQLVEECLKYNLCPTPDVLLKVLDICAQKGEVNLIMDLKRLCEIENVVFAANFDFSLYEARAIWMRGNVIKALDIFEKLYRSNPFLRRYIRVSLKHLMLNGAKNNSEAVLLHIVKFAENMSEKYKDYFPMICVWEVCFMSEWFSDQQIALELLGKNRRLGELLIHRLPFILSLSVKNNRIETVYRLLDILLDFNMSEHYPLVAMTLLDYHFLQGNLRCYSEIIKWCSCKYVVLPDVYKEKYLHLLLNKHERKIHLPANTKNVKFLF